jgi:hypothetical protein
MKLTGRLEDLGLGEMLHVLGAARRSGVLRVRSRDAESVIVFRQGMIVAARHPELPSTLAELFERSGSPLFDTASALEKEASALNVGVLELVAQRGGMDVVRWLETAVERVVASLISTHDGTFEFTLVGDSQTPPQPLDGLVLQHGIAHGRLVGTEVTRTTRESGQDRGVSRLRIPEAELAMPGSRFNPDGRPPEPPKSNSDIVPNVSRTRGGRLLLLALGASEVRRCIEESARATGCDVRHVASLAEADLAVDSALERGLSVAVIGQIPHASLSGLELIARIKSLTRTVPCALIADTATPAVRNAVARERAARLGARVVALIAADVPPEEAREVAEDLVGRLFGAVDESREPSHLAGASALPSGAAILLDGSSATPGDPPEPVDMTTLAQAVAVTSEPSEVALALLQGAACFFERGALLVSEPSGLRLVGAVIPHGDRLPESLSKGRNLAASGDDVVGRSVREGIPFIGPPPTDRASVEVLRLLGAERPGRIAVIPVTEGGKCIAVLYGDDAGDEDRRADLTPLLGFLGDIATSFHSVLEAAARRGEAHALRGI